MLVDDIKIPGILKYQFDNDLLLRQEQWRLFGIHLVKKAFFELETSNRCSFF